MSRITTAGKVVLQYHSNPESRQFLEDKELDKKNISTFFNTLAVDHPKQYKRVVSDLTRLGFETATRMGSTVTLADLLPPTFKEEFFKKLDKDLEDVRAKKLTKAKEDLEISRLFGKFSDEVNAALIEVGLKENKTLAKVVKAGARGSPAQYRQTVFAPVAVNDAKGRILTEFPIRNSFAEGLTLPEYLAHTFGARQGAIATKLAVAEAGFFSKQLARSGMTVKVEESDCGTNNGIPVSTDDKDSVGCYLAKPTGGFNKNNEVTGKMLAELKGKSIDSLVVRSPITCEAPRHSHPGALCQLCAGKRDKGLPPIGDYLGITASTTLGEPLSQGTLNCLIAGTYVRMADYSTRKIESILPGEFVLGADNLGNSFPVLVVNKFNQGKKPVKEYTFRVGCTKETTSVIATSIHKILCNVKKWSCLAQADNHKLQVLPIGSIGKDFNAVKPKKFFHDFKLEEPNALLFGILLGAGCYTEKVRTPHLSCADLSQIEDLNEIYNKTGVYFKLAPGHDIYYKVGPEKSHARNNVTLLLKENGMWGKKAESKVIPEHFYRWSNNSIANLIAGLIVTDGSVFLSGERAAISFSSTSKKLVNQVKELLAWRFCVYSSQLTRTGKSDDIGRNFDQWQITVTDRDSVHNFIEKIPLIGVKRKKLEAYRATISKKFSVGYTMKRVEVKDVGLRQCWDLEVDHPDHLFVLGNGIIVSNSKHESGSARKASTASGFKLINQLANIPEAFKGKAPLVKHDGIVTEVRKAPQGGSYVDVRDTVGKFEEYYIPEGFDVYVKVDQKVEQGDVISEGIINPAEVVALKGIGEGRRYFSEAMKRAFEDSGLGGVNRRNFELLAKGQIDHIRITNPRGLGEFLPDQVVHYHALEKSYQPRTDSKKVRTDQALGKHLEIPELHYTIGTRLSSTMLANLKKHGVEYVTVHDDHPEFEPEMQRIIDVPAFEQDWMHQLYSTNLERRLVQSVNTGASSDLHGSSPVPGLAYGVGFGLNKQADVEEELDSELSIKLKKAEEEDSIEEIEEKLSFE